jgi:glycosyltransferase involved in cell wall biosynthesis
VTSRPLRLLAIGHSYVARRNRDIIRAVAADPGFDVTVAAPRFFHGDLRPIAIEAEPAGSRLDVRGIDARGTRWVHLFAYDRAQTRSLLGEGTFDVVDAWEEPYIYAGYQIGRLAASTTARLSFWTMQNIVKRYPPPFSWFERATLRRADGWIACGALVWDAMMARGYPPAAGRVLPLAVDRDVFHPQSDEIRAQARRTLGLTSPIIGFAGRLVESKGLAVLMRALEGLPARRPWSLLLLGSGPYQERLHTWARERGWANRVRAILAPHHDVARYLGAMDVLVAPSQTTPRWKEQFGRVLIEAMACGVPVLASDSGEIPKVVGDAGRVLPKTDAAAWSAALTEILDDAQMRRHMIERGLARADEYSVERVAAQYREFYRWLAAQPPRRRAQPPGRTTP